MTWSQKALAAFFATAGTLHFVIPRSYEAIMPPSLPPHREAVIVSGVAEIAGGVAVLAPPHPPLRPLVAARPARSRSSPPTSTWRSTPSRCRGSTSTGSRAGRSGRGCRCSRWRCSGSGARRATDSPAFARSMKCFVCRVSVFRGRRSGADGATRPLRRQPAQSPPEQEDLPGGAGLPLRAAPDRDLAARARRPRAAPGHDREALRALDATPDELCTGIRWNVEVPEVHSSRNSDVRAQGSESFEEVRGLFAEADDRAAAFEQRAAVVDEFDRLVERDRADRLAQRRTARRG